MPIRTKRWNDPPEPEDGYRLLVCRYRPRGVKKEGEPWDAWCPALAPSIELHAAAYGKADPRSDDEEAPDAPLDFALYTERYREEMKRQRFWIEGFAAQVRKGETITLLCSSACTDPARCHRTLLKELLEAAAFPERAAASSTPAVVRRTRR